MALVDKEQTACNLCRFLQGSGDLSSTTPSAVSGGPAIGPADGIGRTSTDAQTLVTESPIHVTESATHVTASAARGAESATHVIESTTHVRESPADATESTAPVAKLTPGEGQSDGTPIAVATSESPQEGKSPPLSPQDAPTMAQKSRMRSWTVQHVCEWLTVKGFANMVEIFADNFVDGKLLGALDEEMLRDDLAMTSKLHRTRLLIEIANQIDAESVS